MVVVDAGQVQVIEVVDEDLADVQDLMGVVGCSLVYLDVQQVDLEEIIGLV